MTHRLRTAKPHLLRTYRKRIKEQQRQLELFESGNMRLYVNQVDVSKDAIATLREQMAELQDLIAEYDPHGLTDD